MKRLIALFQVVLEEMGTTCGVCTAIDWKTVNSRYQSEGFSFLTITLPSFAADLEKALACGSIGSSSFPSFKRVGCLPAFLQGFTSLIFDAQTGTLLDVPSVKAVRAIRQICLMFKQVELRCSEERELAAFNKYVKCEYDVRMFDQNYLGSSNQEEFIHASSVLFRTLFWKVEKSILEEDVVPKHSAGATADRLMGNQKYYQKVWPARLQRIIPWDVALLPHSSYASEAYDVDIIEPGAEEPVKVITVPKTQKTPRIIAMEPVCMQYVQQGILHTLIKEAKKGNKREETLNFLTFCQTWDQTSNQRMALQGSFDGSFATLDLSEASDRVSYQHVRDLLKYHPLLLEWVDACRSRKARVPHYGELRLAKFASMGSALCFPFEAMVFTTVVLMGCADALNVPFTDAYVKSMYGRVRVYGDDIVIPVDCVDGVLARLEAFGFKVNLDKSFWSGNFRESCGGNYFLGQDVKHIKVKKYLPTNITDVSELVSAVELHNRFFDYGYFRSADFIRAELARFHLADVLPGTSSVLGLYSYVPKQTIRISKSLQKPLIKAHVAVYDLPYNPVDEHQALMKYFLERGELDPLPKSAYTRSGRIRTARIKTGYFEAR